MKSYQIGCIDCDTIKMVYQSSDDKNLLDFLDNLTEEDVSNISNNASEIIMGSEIIIDCIDMAVQQYMRWICEHESSP